MIRLLQELMGNGWRIFLNANRRTCTLTKGPARVVVSFDAVRTGYSQCTVWDLYLDLWRDWRSIDQDERTHHG